jgi:hypothetical protein
MSEISKNDKERGLPLVVVFALEELTKKLEEILAALQRIEQKLGG